MSGKGEALSGVGPLSLLEFRALLCQITARALMEGCILNQSRFLTYRQSGAGCGCHGGREAVRISGACPTPLDKEQEAKSDNLFIKYRGFEGGSGISHGVWSALTRRSECGHGWAGGRWGRR